MFNYNATIAIVSELMEEKGSFGFKNFSISDVKS